MQEKSPVEKGWDFSTSVMGANVATYKGSEYIDNIDAMIDKMTKDMNKLADKNLDVQRLKGFVAEVWHADTFNANSATRDSASRVNFDGSNEHASVDISTNFGKSYGLKYYKTAANTAKQQAKSVFDKYHDYLHSSRKGEPMRFEDYLEKNGYTKDVNIQKLIQEYKASDKINDITLEQYIENHNGDYDVSSLISSVYKGQKRLVSKDQFEEVKKYLENKIKTESEKGSPNRIARLKSLNETFDNIKDRIDNGEGVESIPLSIEESERIARAIKDGDFDPKDFGIELKSLIRTDDIINQAIKAGYSAAILTLITQLAPEIFKAIDYLIKNGELNPKDLIRLGETGISAGAEGFLRGSISSSLYIMCESGKLGTAFVGIPAPIIGTMTVLAMQTIKNSILVAAGKMTPQQMGEAFVDTVVISSGYLIGGAIGQALLAGAPVVGYLLGSLVGTAFSVVYNIGKKKLISFCVDTGFTCFGLVEQDYQLPEEVLNSMGINTIKISQTPIHQTRISTTQISQAAINRQSYETIGFTMPRRGIIGVNKVGYIV